MEEQLKRLIDCFCCQLGLVNAASYNNTTIHASNRSYRSTHKLWCWCLNQYHVQQSLPCQTPVRAPVSVNVDLTSFFSHPGAVLEELCQLNYPVPQQSWKSLQQASFLMLLVDLHLIWYAYLPHVYYCYSIVLSPDVHYSIKLSQRCHSQKKGIQSIYLKSASNAQQAFLKLVFWWAGEW
jgi:hypothetical protein